MPKLRIYAAGSNSHGQLGTGNNEDAHDFVLCPLDHDIEASDLEQLTVKIATGANHTLLLLKFGEKQELYVAGSSHCKQLGKLSADSLHTFTPLSIRDLLPLLSGDDWTRLPVSARNLRVSDIAASWETSFILLESKRDSSVTCLVAMGSNDYGELGGRVDENYDGPHLVPLSASVGIASILAGPRHIVAIDRDGRAAGWGSARHGQLERLNVLSSWRPKVATLAAFTGNQRYSSIAVGHQHTCLVTGNERSVHVIGSNKKGQLGSSGSKDTVATLSLPKKTATTVHATWSSTFMLFQYIDKHKVISFGNNAHGQLGRSGSPISRHGEVVFPLPESRIKQLSAGSEHVLSILDVDGQDQVFGWGWNEHGNLGQAGDLTDVIEPRKIWPISAWKGKVISVHAGNGTSWIVTLEAD